MLALPLALVFVAAFPAVLFGFVFLTTALDPNHVKDAVKRTSTYEVIVGQVIPTLALGQLEGTGLATTLGAAALTSAIRSVVPAVWVEETVESAIDQVLPYLAGRAPGLSVRVDFEPAKLRLVEELASIAQVPAPMLEAFERDVLVLIPDGGTISEVVFPPLRTLRDTITVLRSALLVGAAVLALLLFVLSLLGGRGVRGRLQWAAGTVAAGALLAWTLAFGAETALPQFVREAVVSNPYAEDNGLVAGLLGDVLGEVARETVAPAILAARIVSIGATAVFMITLLVPRRR